MTKEILAGVLALSLSGCSLFGLNSLEPGNLIKTTAASTVAYVTGGPVPALSVLLT